jgi:hypothetical protein
MIKLFLALILFTQFSFAQISGGSVDVNVLGGSLTLSGTSTVSGTVAVSNSSFGISGSLPAGSNAIGSITNTVFGATQSGTWNIGTVTSITNPVAVTGTFFQATQPVSAVSLPLPTGASTSANQTTANASLSSIDSKLTSPLSTSRTWALAQSTDSTSAWLKDGVGNAVTSSAAGSARPLDVQLHNSAGNPFGTNTNPLRVDPTGTTTQPVSAASLPLPTGAATSALQTTINTAQTSGSQKTQIVNSGGASISSLSDGNGGQALEVAMVATNFIFSTTNSSTVQLASGATFNGTVETVVNQQSASILLTTDQNGTLVFSEYIDAGGARVSRTTTASIVANIPYSRSFVINGNYFKVAFTNNGGATTTTFNLNTAYGTIPSATALGNGQVSLDEVNGLAFSTSVKGVQATNLLPTQDVKDAGRVSKAYSAVFTAATTEALVTLTPISDGTAAATATSFGVTSGKRLRIQQVCVSTRNAGAAGQGVVIQLRMTSTGAVTATSPLVGTIATGTNLAIANSANSDCMVMPDGFELSGTQQFGVSQVGSATANNTVVIQGFEY